MNLFTSDKAPAILVVLLSVVGFYVSTVVTEIRGQAAVTYDFTTDRDGSASLRLKNVALATTVENARFEMACLSQRPDCLDPMSDRDGDFHRLTRLPPVSPNNIDVVSSARGAVLSATLLPGAVIEITVQRSGRAISDKDELVFFYNANEDAPQVLLLLKSAMLTSLLIDKYFDVMVLAFMAALVGLVVVIFLPFFRKPTAIQTKAVTPSNEKEKAP